MCGLVAMFAYHPVAPDIDRDELRTVRDHMIARGPDGEGEWFSEDGRVAFGHRRLSIVDLTDAGRQPMENEDGSIKLIFNGEIYNYRSLREKLIERGHTFRSNTDSETIVHLYEEKGDALVEDLRGMFAFALWDESKGAMLLARDPYGIKPLYYADDGWTVRAASQVKALVAGGRVSKVPEPAGIVGFYLTGSVPEPFTTYQQIRAVPAGSILWVNALGVSEAKSYFSISQVFHDARKNPVKVSEPELAALIREALIDSVRHHMVADVAVSAFLSAGIDSGTVVALASEAGANSLQTVTLAFEEYQNTEQDEAPLARSVAQLYGTNHSARLLGQSEFQRELPRVLAAMDQPSIDGVNTYFVSKAAKESGVKVALSGLGGDELFSGYPSFKAIPKWVRGSLIPASVPGMGRAFRRVSLPLLPQKVSPKLAGMIEYAGSYAGAYLLKRGLFMPWELKALVGEETAREGLRRLAPLKLIGSTLRPDPGTAYSRVAAMEAAMYMRNQLLRDTDWASMAHSVEVRVPLVDARFLKTVAPALVANPNLASKRVLAEIATPALPRAITGRNKTGFTVPVADWIEQSRDLDVWREVPQLSRPGTHWSRRWAYTSVSLGMAL